ncbi:MAG: lipoyl(octanoyl) transferase LipB [Myxococcota bacterium]
MSRSRSSLVVEHLGRVSYATAWRRQEALREARIEGRVPDTLLLLEHPDVITFGRGARPGTARMDEAALRARGYEVFRVNRGGDVTWHGPGQLVGYPILDLQARGRDVHVYLRTLEGLLISVLAEFGIPALRRAGYTGVWLDAQRKIASIGVGIRHWVTLHGFALNVSPDLERFSVIVPCGLEDVKMTSMREVVGDVEMPQVEARVEAAFRRAFDD